MKVFPLNNYFVLINCDVGVDSKDKDFQACDHFKVVH